MELAVKIFYAPHWTTDILPEFKELWLKDKTLAKKILFAIRDRRRLGFKEPFRKVLLWLAEEYPHETSMEIIHEIPIYGSWKDLLIFCGTKFEQYMIRIFTHQLIKDLYSMEQNDKISIIAKYMPSEGSSLDKKFSLVTKLCKHMKISRKEYRTKFLVPLRSKIDLIETKMCRKKWNDIDYSKVPSVALHRYESAFRKHDRKRFEKFESTRSYTDKIKIFEIVLVDKYTRDWCYPDPIVMNEIIEQEWLTIKSRIKIRRKIPIMIDVSGSMVCLPIAVAMTCVMLCGEKYATFGDGFLPMPKTEKLVDSINQILSAPWKPSYDTDKIKNWTRKTTLVMSDAPYETCSIPVASEITKIRLIHWHVCNQHPMISDDIPGIITVTGYSDELFEYLVGNGDITPESFMNHCIDNKRYDDE